MFRGARYFLDAKNKACLYLTSCSTVNRSMFSITDGERHCSTLHTHSMAAEVPATVFADALFAPSTMTSSSGSRNVPSSGVWRFRRLRRFRFFLPSALRLLSGSGPRPSGRPFTGSAGVTSMPRSRAAPPSSYGTGAAVAAVGSWLPMVDQSP